MFVDANFVPFGKIVEVWSGFRPKWSPSLSMKVDHELMAIQQAAGIDLPCTSSDSHKCTPKCHVYTLHDIRRGHATFNYGRVTDRELQRQMGHASFATTRSYAKYAETHRKSTYDAHLPTLAKAKAQGLKVASELLEKQNGGQETDKLKTAAVSA